VIKNTSARIKENIIFTSLVSVILSSKVREYRASPTLLDNGCLLGGSNYRCAGPATAVALGASAPIQKTCSPSLPDLLKARYFST